MVMENIFSKLTDYGLPGLVIGVLGLLLHRRDMVHAAIERELRNELRTEMAARIDDAKSYTDLALKLQSSVMSAVEKQASMVDTVERLIDILSARK